MGQGLAGTAIAKSGAAKAASTSEEASVTVDKGRLTAAHVDDGLGLDGHEHRVPDCDNPDHDQARAPRSE